MKNTHVVAARKPAEQLANLRFFIENACGCFASELHNSTFPISLPALSVLTISQISSNSQAVSNFSISKFTERSLNTEVMHIKRQILSALIRIAASFGMFGRLRRIGVFLKLPSYLLLLMVVLGRYTR